MSRPLGDLECLRFILSLHQVVDVEPVDADAFKEKDLLDHLARKSDNGWVPEYYILAFVEPLNCFLHGGSSQSEILGEMAASLFEFPFPQSLLSVDPCKDTSAGENRDVVNGLPVELEVDIREISKELALDGSVKAGSAIANVDHRNFEALLKN